MDISHLNILFNIFSFVDRKTAHRALQVSKNLRDCLGRSKIWEKFDRTAIYKKPYKLIYADLLKSICIQNIVKRAIELEIEDIEIQLQSYYGDYYYLYIIREFVDKLSTFSWFWNFNSLLLNLNRMNEISTISSLVYKTIGSRSYETLIYSIARMEYYYSGDLSDPEYQKIFKKIYVNNNYSGEEFEGFSSIILAVIQPYCQKKYLVWGGSNIILAYRIVVTSNNKKITNIIFTDKNNKIVFEGPKISYFENIFKKIANELEVDSFKLIMFLKHLLFLKIFRVKIENEIELNLAT